MVEQTLNLVHRQFLPLIRKERLNGCRGCVGHLLTSENAFV